MYSEYNFIYHKTCPLCIYALYSVGTEITDWLPQVRQLSSFEFIRLFLKLTWIFHKMLTSTWRISTNVLWLQPSSQGLSSLPPLVIGRKTLVVAGQITTQNLGGKKSVGWEGWQSILFAWCDKLCGFQILQQSLNYLLSGGVRIQICQWRMLHDFCHLQNTEDLYSQRNLAAEWKLLMLRVSKCKRPRTGSKWDQWISLLNLWIRRQFIFFFVRFSEY